MTDHLTLDDLLTLVDDLDIGPVRDIGLLESAAHRPAAIVWGQEVYSTIDEKAAALLESVVRNHALVDGNKRLGWLGVVVFYAINGERLEAPDDEAYELVMQVAAGDIELAAIMSALARWH
ncbi:type II toxin-antitoxin system death-on-curing family toxin [Nocardioides sp.]|uniref:type II toxin-antitoxin system death-on-curing family toxin n=1 Tax=Nocardioides sp. TaxID=35761 RepID=UPI0035AE04C8